MSAVIYIVFILSEDSVFVPMNLAGNLHNIFIIFHSLTGLCENKHIQDI